MLQQKKKNIKIFIVYTMHKNNLVDVDNYLDKCNDKISTIRRILEDDALRSDVRQSNQDWLNYWTDEFWIANDERQRLVDQQLSAEETTSNFN